MNNWELLMKEKKQYKDTLVLDMFEMVLLKDIIDWEDDYYYVYEKLDGETYESSCCVWFTPLIDLKEKDYKRLEYWWRLNSWNPKNQISRGDILVKRKDKESSSIFMSIKLTDQNEIDSLVGTIEHEIIEKGIKNVIFFIDNKEWEITTNSLFYKQVLSKLKKSSIKYTFVYDSLEQIIQQYYLI